MIHSTARRLCRYVVAISMCGAALGLSSPSDAFVNKIVIDSVNTAMYNPIPLGSSTQGPAVSYTIYTGRIFGLLDPVDPHNAGITDIDLSSSAGFTAPGPNGTAQYISQFSIVTPTDPAQRNGLLIYEVSNRGGNAIPTTGLIQGVTYVQSGWQGDLLSQCSGATGALPAAPYPCVNLNSVYGTASASYPFFTPPTGLTSFVIQVPVATTDRNPPGPSNTITGPVYGHIQTGANSSTAQLVIFGSAFVPFQPANIADTASAQFWFETSQSTDGVDTGKTAIASNQWAWAYCPSGPPGTPNPNWICLNSGPFDPTKLYEMVFTAANPLVQGVGFAGVRDFVSFLRYGTTAPGGGTNPIAGTVTKAMTIGSSQSGNLIRGVIFYGFTQDESNRIVFEGAWARIAGRMLWMMPRWSQPNVLVNLYMGGNEAPIWYSDFPNQARGLPAAGMLDRCTATATCPQILESWGGQEFYTSKMSGDFVGFCSTCTTEIPRPPNVYQYYVRGATHGGGAVNFNWVSPPSLPVNNNQTLPTSPIPETFTNNALQDAFIKFIMFGTPMPPSVSGVTYPSFAQGQLVPVSTAATNWPNIPGLPYGGLAAWHPFVYDFGPGEDYANQSGIPTISPPTILQILPAFVPTVNPSDGNENVGGIPTVLGEAPLGSYAGWNIIPTGPYAGQQVQLNGGYYPFWDTQAHRMAASDPRPSLEERYGSHSGYNCVVGQAAVNAVQQRFLLQSDATTLMNMASAGNVLNSPFVPTGADLSLANNVLCGLTATHNFNGSTDIKSDVLWRDGSGNLAVWLMNGSSVLQSAPLGNVPTVWSVVGQRDFNGDGNGDVLWRDSSGNVAIWLMNGTTIISAAGIGNVPTAWSIVATGDFNGDGKGDIVWRDTAGNVAIWLMNGTSVMQSIAVGNVPTSWTIVGGDNKGDIFWRNTTTGDVAVWVMSGGTITKSVSFGAVALSWTVAGIGDFDGNGSEDILWRDGAGNVVIWLLSGTQIMANAVVGNVPLAWAIVETGDYNGDGKTDILFMDGSGNVAAWFMNGATLFSVASYGNVGTWVVQGQNAD